MTACENALDTVRQLPRSIYAYLLQSAVKMLSQSVEVSHWMEVPSKEIKVQTSGGEVEVKPPSVHIGYKPVPMLLLSYRWRGSQVRLGHECCELGRKICMSTRYINGLAS